MPASAAVQDEAYAKARGAYLRDLMYIQEDAPRIEIYVLEDGRIGLREERKLPAPPEAEDAA